MTATRLGAYVGRKGSYRIPGTDAYIVVAVVDASTSYGRTVLEVAPVAGEGTFRVTAEKVIFNEQEGTK